MRLAATETASTLRFAAAFDRLDRGARFWLASIIAVALSLGLRLDGLTADVSWLLTMCERMLSGEKAYVDIFETTPPIPTLLYMPAATISRATGLNSAIILVLWTYLCALYAVFLAWRIMPSESDVAFSQRERFAAISIFSLFFLANDAFAQREYFAAAFVLPIASVLIRHSQTSKWIGGGLRWQAILLAGLAVAIKPPLFALPGVFAAVYHLWTTRDLRSLYSSGLIAAAMFSAALTAISLISFPAYLENLTPYMRDIYVAYRTPLLDGIRTPQFWAIATPLVATLVYFRQAQRPYAIKLLVAMSIGFAVAFVLQNKFYWYHSYPAMFLGGMCAFDLIASRLAPLLVERSLSISSLSKLTVAMLIGAGLCAQMLNANDDKAYKLQNMAWADGKTGMTASAISTGIEFSFPLARKIDAIWVDRIHGQWVAGYARRMLKSTARSDENYALYQQYFDNEMDRVAALIAAKKPALLFVDLASPWLQDELLNRDPAVFADYVTIAEEGKYRILYRETRPIEPAAQQ